MESWVGGTEVYRRCPCASASRRPPRLQGDVPRKPPNNVSRHNSLLPHEQPQWSPRAKGSTGIGPRSPRSTGAMLQFASRVDSPESNRLSAAARCSSSRQLQQEAAAGMPGGCLHKTSSTGSLPIRARDPSPFRAGDVEWFREESPPPRSKSPTHQFTPRRRLGHALEASSTRSFGALPSPRDLASPRSLRGARSHGMLPSPSGSPSGQLQASGSATALLTPRKYGSWAPPSARHEQSSPSNRAASPGGLHQSPSRGRTGSQGAIGEGSPSQASQPPVQTRPPPMCPAAMPVDPQSVSLDALLAQALIAKERSGQADPHDKLRALDFFQQTMNVRHIIKGVERAASSKTFLEFRNFVGPCACEVAFYAPAGPSQLACLHTRGFCKDDFEEVAGCGFGIPVASHAGLAHRKAHTLLKLLEGSSSSNGGRRCICVLLCKAGVIGSSNGGQLPGSWKECCVQDPRQIFLAYVIWYRCSASESAGSERSSVQRAPGSEASQSDRQSSASVPEQPCMPAGQQGYTRLRDALIDIAKAELESAEKGARPSVSTLHRRSLEAKSVVALYLLSGGSEELQRAFGVDRHEAMSSVSVLRINNQPFYERYRDHPVLQSGGTGNGAPSNYQYCEDIVWHGSHFERDGADNARLVSRIQTIAKRGFDPQKCPKTEATVGICVSSTPPSSLVGSTGSFSGHVAFILCLAKTHPNEWVGGSCAYVCHRERVLPLYVLVHSNPREAGTRQDKNPKDTWDRRKAL